MKTSNTAKEQWNRKAYKCRVVPHKEDLENLKKINICLVTLWNMAIDQINFWLAMPSEILADVETKITWQENVHAYIVTGTVQGMVKNPYKKSITYITLTYWLTDLRNTDNPLFTEVSCGLQREMLRRLAGGYASYFQLLKNKDARARPPMPKEDVENSFIALTWTGDVVAHGNTLALPIAKKCEVGFIMDGTYMQKKLVGLLPVGAVVAQLTITKKDGEYWANFVCNIPKPPQPTLRGIMAIDLGSGNIAISTSNGDEYIFHARRPDKKWRKEIKSVEDRADKCKKGSRAWKRRMKARRIMHNKSLHQHSDHQRKLAKLLAEQKMTIVVGKMKVRLGLAQSSGTADQHWGAQNTGYLHQQLKFLKEKADEYGLPFIELSDPARKGAVEQPHSKFHASRELLRLGCEKFNTPFPDQIKLIDFAFRHG